MHKTNSTTFKCLSFNKSKVQQTACQQHLGMVLDCKLDFQERLKAKLKKANKSIAVLQKIENKLPRASLRSQEILATIII